MKNLLYTFGLIMTLLAVFLGIWWYQSYQKDLAALRDQVEGELNQLVTEDFVYPTLQAFMHERTGLREGTVLWQDDSSVLDRRVVRVKRVISDPFGRPKTVEVVIIQGTRPVANTHFYYDNRRIALDRLPETVQDSMLRKFGVNLQPIAPELTDGNDRPRFGHPRSDAQKVRDPMVVEVKHVANGGKKYPKARFVITRYHSSLLWGLLPEFFFGLVLFGATGLAFTSAYRSLHEQRQQLQAKDVLVANVAHELKTPIATVGVALEALNLFGADSDPAKRREYLAIGQSELKRLDALADRAIDSLQDDKLAARLNLGRTDLTTSIREAWRGLSLRYHLPADALVLSTYGDTNAEVDRHYWQHLVYNLLDNACKYGGRPLGVRVNVGRHAGEVVLSVTDNGPGIPLSERERIFDRFYRVYRPGEGHAVKGHGLGLSFVRQIARAHGGSVEVDNARSGGARFTVRLPAHS